MPRITPSRICRLRDYFFIAYALRRRDRTKTQRIKHRNRPRAHSKNVAQDSAHAGGRALKRLNETRMIVRLDLEHCDESVADIHHARVLAGALHHMRAARRQPLQMRAARFVRAVLAPHHAEDAQLGNVRVASQNFLDTRVFVEGKAVFSGNLRGNFDLGVDGTHEFSGTRLVNSVDVQAKKKGMKSKVRRAARIATL